MNGCWILWTFEASYCSLLLLYYLVLVLTIYSDWLVLCITGQHICWLTHILFHFLRICLQFSCSHVVAKTLSAVFNDLIWICMKIINLKASIRIIIVIPLHKFKEICSLTYDFPFQRKLWFANPFQDIRMVEETLSHRSFVSRSRWPQLDMHRLRSMDSEALKDIV